MAMLPNTGPNDPRLPKHIKPGGQFDPNSRGGPDLEGPGFRHMVNRPDHNGGGQGGGLLSAFLPGQRNALAQQFNQGFGGGIKQWNGILGQAYQNMQIPQNPLGYPIPSKPDTGGVDPGKDGNDGGGNGPDVPGIDTGHHNPAAQYLGAQMQNAGPMARPGQTSAMSAPAQGPLPPQVGMQPLNNIQGPAQPNLMFGQQPLSPQVMALLRARFGG